MIRTITVSLAATGCLFASPVVASGPMDGPRAAVATSLAQADDAIDAAEPSTEAAEPSTEAAEAAEGDEATADADESGTDDAAGRDGRLGTIRVTRDREDLDRVGGSVTLIDEEALEAFEFEDPTAALAPAPGVYVRQEDGFGLRPNIGIWGTDSERSRRITLMEDEVLAGPAPYAAPAAYYFPLLGRMTGIEVFKGPAAIAYGPHTIGGAINLISREIPDGPEGGVDASIGMHLANKLHLHWGTSNDRFGILIEGLHLGSDGFKDLDGGGDTGFVRDEFVLTGMVRSNPTAYLRHRLEVRAGYSREISHETYLGLSDADFDADPFRRYAASELDRMAWWRTQGRIGYRLDVGDDLDVRVVGYRHDFSRTWRKVNGFVDGPSFSEILADPDSGERQIFYDVLTGAQDTSVDAEQLIIGGNGRDYISQGVQTSLRYRAGDEDRVDNELEIGLRVHNDSVDRDHTAETFAMQDGGLVDTGADAYLSLDNDARALAIAGFVRNRLTWQGLTVEPGLRYEHIETELNDDLAGTSSSNTQDVVLPGIGTHYAFTEQFGVLAGVHRGFSPVSPGQPNAVDPETSTNYEAGVRYSEPRLGTLYEVVGFFNDYNNLLGECSFSRGCDEDQLDDQFNAGEVDVYGVEIAASQTVPLTPTIDLGVDAAYTLTQSRFASDFVSGNPAFGEVEAGDELPYVPTHQGSLQLGLLANVWGANVRASYVGAMREQSGGGGPLEGAMTDPIVMLDALAFYEIFRDAEVYVKGENLTNARPVASRRPYGARPARPLMAHVGFRWSF